MNQAGVPWVEYRPQPEVNEDVIITVEFTPEPQSPDSEYQYSQPEFVFSDLVATRQDWEHCHKHHLPQMRVRYISHLWNRVSGFFDSFR